MWLYNFVLGLSFKELLLFLVVFILIADYIKHKNPANYPPGPLSLPLVGSLFSVDSKKPHIYFFKLADVYGNVFSVRLGGDKMVFVSGYKMMKEALVSQADNFVDRPSSPIADRIYLGQGGIFLSNGEKWKKQRRFVLTTLRSFGMGKNILEQSICQESHYLQEEMENYKGEAFDPARLFNNATANIICQLVFGKHFDYSDHNFQTMLKSMSEAIYLEGTIWGMLYESFPGVMKYMPGEHNTLFAHYKNLLAFIAQEVNSHKQDLDPSNPRDYIDVFLMEMEKQKGQIDMGFDETNLTLCGLDLFLAGTETTSTTLNWALLFLIKYPHIQEKVQSEIDSVIGQFRQPTMADKANMPYTDAVIHEIQRMGNIVPLNGLRMAAVDTTLGGYFIPKGTSLMPHLTSVMFDKTEWETPDIFNPGHFLDADGKFVKRDAFLPFSAGRRACPGEALAKMELFLFFVTLLQKFSFSTLDGVELSTEGMVGATQSPHPYKIYAKIR